MLMFLEEQNSSRLKRIILTMLAIDSSFTTLNIVQILGSVCFLGLNSSGYGCTV